ncbi:MAG: Fic family protein [Ulvibacter sp.]|jgi:Fic family protein
MSKTKPVNPPNSEFSIESDIYLFKIAAENPEIKEIIKDYNERYLYWDEVKRRPIPKIDKLTHESFWKLIRFNRNTRSSDLNISPLPDFKFNYNLTDYIQKQLHRFDLNLGGVLEGSTTIPDGQGDKYMISALMEEAIASSQLEGAATTRKVAKEMLRSERKPKNESERMILNNYLTIQEIKKHTQSPLTPELIKSFHEKITNGTLEDSQNEGVFRENDNVNVVDYITGEVYYRPPSNNIINDAILDICDFANEEKGNDFIHPILRAITLHFLIGYLHPFVDGNGRTARALFYWCLLSKGYWLLEYISISRTILDAPSQYARAYLCTEQDGNDLTYFFNYNLKVLMKATKDFRKYVARKATTKADVYSLQKAKDFNERQIEIILRIHKEKHKAITIKEVQNTYGIVTQTARTDLLELQKMGFLESRKMGRKLIFYKTLEFDNLLAKLKNNQA